MTLFTKDHLGPAERPADETGFYVVVDLGGTRGGTVIVQPSALEGRTIDDVRPLLAEYLNKRATVVGDDALCRELLAGLSVPADALRE